MFLPFQIVVYTTEHKIPLATPEKFTPVPTPRRTRSRSRSQVSRFTDDDRTSRGAESLVSEIHDGKNVLDLNAGNGYVHIGGYFWSPNYSLLLYTTLDMRLSKKIHRPVLRHRCGVSDRPSRWAAAARGSSLRCPICRAALLDTRRHRLTHRPDPEETILRLYHRGHLETSRTTV